MHIEIEPAIQYWGTPVVLISTMNEDGSVNVAPMSSVWWLGWSAMLGLDASSKTVENLSRDRSCVLNLASEENTDAVNRLALTTGSRRVPIHKRALGYSHVAKKLEHAGLTTLPSTTVRAPRLQHFLVHLECEVVAIRPFAKADARMAVPACSVELQIRKVHVEESLVTNDRIDPERWKPLLMSFRQLFARGPRAGASRLAQGDESLYAPWKRALLGKLATRLVRAVATAQSSVSGCDEDIG